MCLVVTSNWTSYIEATTVALLQPDSLSVSSSVNEPVISLELLPFNVYVDPYPSQGLVYSINYSAGSNLVTVTIEPDLYSVNPTIVDVSVAVSSPVLSQDTYVLSPDSIAVTSHVALTSVFEPPVVEVGVSPGYPKIDDIPALASIDFEFSVLAILDAVDASTCRIDTQQVPTADITGLASSANIAILSDEPNDVRIDT